MKRTVLALALVLAGGVFADPQGYGGGKKGQGKPERNTIQVTANHYRFSPNQIQVRRGQQVNVTLKNQSDHPHNIMFQIGNKRYSLPKNLSRGQSGTVSFRAPSANGQYGFYCPVGDHASRGMRGTLIVR